MKCEHGMMRPGGCLICLFDEDGFAAIAAQPVLPEEEWIAIVEREYFEEICQEAANLRAAGRLN